MENPSEIQIREGPWLGADVIARQARINAKLAAAVAILRGIEWAGDATMPICPCCRRHKSQWHETNCELERALGR